MLRLARNLYYSLLVLYLLLILIQFIASGVQSSDWAMSLYSALWVWLPQIGLQWLAARTVVSRPLRAGFYQMINALWVLAIVLVFILSYPSLPGDAYEFVGLVLVVFLAAFVTVVVSNIKGYNLTGPILEIGFCVGLILLCVVVAIYRFKF